MRTRDALLVLLLAVPLLAGCAGRSCDDLPALRADRDAARTAFTRLVEPGTAPPEVLVKADDDLHALDRRVFDLEQSCQER